MYCDLRVLATGGSLDAIRELSAAAGHEDSPDRSTGCGTKRTRVDSTQVETALEEGHGATKSNRPVFFTGCLPS
jgi:hypothetical protein